VGEVGTTDTACLGEGLEVGGRKARGGWDLERECCTSRTPFHQKTGRRGWGARTPGPEWGGKNFGSKNGRKPCPHITPFDEECRQLDSSVDKPVEGKMSFAKGEN